MPLLNIVGVTCMHKTFHISFCFLSNETEESYNWALCELAKLFTPGYKPGVIIMDRDLALLNAVFSVFPQSKRQLCTWHVEKNVLIQASLYFREAADREEFMKAWTTVIQSTSTTAYEANWSALKLRYQQYPRLIHYITVT